MSSRRPAGLSGMQPIDIVQSVSFPAIVDREVEWSLEFDTDARSAAVPSDLADALEAAPDALHRFESLPYDRQRRFVDAVEGAPTPELRERRIALAIERLRLVA